MARVAASVMIVLVAGCGSSDGGDPAPGDAAGDSGAGAMTGANDAAIVVGEPSQLAGITTYHNQIRAMVDTTGIAAGALPALSWDDALAAIAATWVAKCTDRDGDGLVDHNPDRSTGQPTYVGENIYASSGTANPRDAVVDGWAGESAHYHYDANTCDSGAVCGHYTQVVWRATERLGCAIATCPGLTFKSTIVCDYGPGGNVNNQRPY